LHCASASIFFKLQYFLLAAPDGAPTPLRESERIKRRALEARASAGIALPVQLIFTYWVVFSWYRYDVVNYRQVIAATSWYHCVFSVLGTVSRTSISKALYYTTEDEIDAACATDESNLSECEERMPALQFSGKNRCTSIFIS
jgi:hypothetical protein